MKSPAILISLIIFNTLSLRSCDNKNRKPLSGLVKFDGALQNIMAGDMSAKINLDSLSDTKSLYALGAMENLKGEIQIFNGTPSISSVKDSVLEISDSYNAKAALLVYARVKEWSSFQIHSKTVSELEQEILDIAKTNGIHTENPFPFLIQGEVPSVHWHVINWKDGDSIHSHAKHKKSGLNGELNNIEVEIIGFYSTKHKGIFTHHTSNMHMHFKSSDNSMAGHVDDLELNGVTLKLPKQ